MRTFTNWLLLAFIAQALLGLSSTVSADDLEPRYYPPGSTNLVAYYDPHLDITVTADMNMLFTHRFGAPPHSIQNYDNAVVYINNLNFINNQAGYLDVNTWRLPKSTKFDHGCVPLIPGFPADGLGYFCNESEMGHIFYTEFNGQKLQGLPATWPFKQTVYNWYWSSTRSASLIVDPHTPEKTRFSFDMSHGFQLNHPEVQEGAVWPVTDGDPLARPALTRRQPSGNNLSFDNTDVNTTSTHVERLILENTGDAPLTMQAITQSNAAEFPLVADHCSGQVLNPGEQCEALFGFSPVRDGGRSSTIQIVSDALSSPDTVTAIGTGDGVAVEVVSPSEHDFGFISIHHITPQSFAASKKQIILSNTGTSAFNVLSVVSDQSEFVVSYDTCSGKDISPPGIGEFYVDCQIVIKFHPTVPGAISGHILITTDSATSPISVAVTGTGTDPKLVLSSYIQNFGLQALNTTSTAHTVTATNAGNETLLFRDIGIGTANIGIRSDSSEFTIINNQCGLGLNIGASCTFDIVFEPIAQGPRSGTVHIAGYDRNVLVSGTGEAVGLELLIPNDLHFGEQAVGSSSAIQPVQLVNLGSGDISVTSVVPDNTDFVVETDGCSGQIVAPNTGCGFSVRFNPSVSGSRTGHVVVNSDAPSSPDNVAVTGTGTVPVLSASPGQLMFAPQAEGTNALPETLLVTNTGKADLVISALNSAIPDFPIISENCIGSTLASGGNCQVVVGFTPGRDGGISSSIAISSNASSSPDNVIVSGSGIGASAALLSPTELHFGAQALGTTTAPSVVTVTNSGDVNLSVTSLSSDNSEYVIVNDGCTGQSIIPTGSCQFGVQFSVSALGIQNGHITVTSDAPSSPDHVALTGTGIAPAVLLSTSNIVFGTLPIGDTSPAQTITATNTSVVPLSVSSIASSNAEFSLSADTCSGQILPAAAQCTFAVSFTPTSDGAQSALLQFVSDAGTSPDTISAAGSGKRVSGETLSPASLVFPIVGIAHPGVIKQVLLTNIGSTNLVVGSMSSVSPHYSVVEDQCSGQTIAPQSHCGFSVEFSPLAIGIWNSQIEILTSDPDSPLLLSVTGTGSISVPPPAEPATPIPTMSKWALIMLFMLLGLIVVTNRRRLF